MSWKIEEIREKRDIHQSQDILELHQEFEVEKITETAFDFIISRFKSPKKSLNQVKSLLSENFKIKRFSVNPNNIAKITEKKELEINTKAIDEITKIIKTDFEFKIPGDEISKIIEFHKLNEIERNGKKIVKLQIRNRKDWKIGYVKFTIPLPGEKIKSLNFFEIESPSSKKERKVETEKENSKIQWMQTFEPKEDKFFKIEYSLKEDYSEFIEISPKFGGFNVTKKPTISLLPGESLDGYKEFLEKVLKNLSGEVWWVDPHFNEDGLDLLKETKKENLTNIKILTGPKQLSDSFKTEYDLFGDDMEEHEIVCELKVTLDKGLYENYHDRFLFDDEFMYKLPPCSLLKKSGYSLLQPVNDPERREGIRKKFKNKVWENSTPISNWGKIKSSDLY